MPAPAGAGRFVIRATHERGVGAPSSRSLSTASREADSGYINGPTVSMNAFVKAVGHREIRSIAAPNTKVALGLIADMPMYSGSWAMPPMTGVLDPSAPHDDVGCGRQLARGQKKIELIGPISEVAGAVLEPH